MTERIKAGEFYLELPEGLPKSRVVVAEKSELPDPLEGPAYSSYRNDPVQEFITGAGARAASKVTSLPAETNTAPAKTVDAETEWNAFCGQKSRYPRKWAAYRDKTAKTCGFNPFAFCFGINWFFFHRMYVTGIMLAFAEIAPIVAFVLLASPSDVDLHPIRHLWLPILFVLAFLPKIATGYWANIALFKRATLEIDKIRALNLDPERHLSLIRSAGEVNITAVILLNIVLNGSIGLTKHLIQNS